MALQFRGAYVRDGVKRFATTSPLGEYRKKEREKEKEGKRGKGKERE